MTFLKSLWRKLFKVKMGSFDSEPYSDNTAKLMEAMKYSGLGKARQERGQPSAYDPSQDPEKLLRGEFESYFE